MCTADRWTVTKSLQKVVEPLFELSKLCIVLLLLPLEDMSSVFGQEAQTTSDQVLIERACVEAIFALGVCDTRFVACVGVRPDELFVTSFKSKTPTSLMRRT